MRDFVKYMYMMRLERHQYHCLKRVFPAVLQRAYGSSAWSRNRHRLWSEWGLAHILSVVLWVVQRQFGKTELMTRVLAAAMLAFPNVENPGHPLKYLSVGQSGQRARDNLGRTYQVLQKIADMDPSVGDRFEFRIPRGCAGSSSPSYIEVRSRLDPLDVRRVEARDTGQGLRGETRAFMFIDEFFAVSEGIAMTVLVPMYQASGTVAITATTLNERQGWSQSWVNSGGSDKTPVDVTNYSQVCPACLKKPTDELLRCRRRGSTQRGA